MKDLRHKSMSNGHIYNFEQKIIVNDLGTYVM